MRSQWRFIAKRLVEHLERSGFIIMKVHNDERIVEN